MVYIYDEDAVLDEAKTIINRFASKTMDDQGGPLYDYIRITSRDEETLKRYLKDAVGTFAVRMRDYCEGEKPVFFWHLQQQSISIDRATATAEPSATDTLYKIDFETEAPETIVSSVARTSVTIRPVVGQNKTLNFLNEKSSYSFYLPDFDAGKKEEACRLINNYVVNSCVARWLMDRFPVGADLYTGTAQACSDTAKALLLNRKRYQRQ